MGHHQRVATVRVEDRGAPLLLGQTGIAGPSWIDVRAELDDLPGLSITFRLDFAGWRYVIRNVSVGQYGDELTEVTGEALRMVPLQSLARQAVTTVLLTGSDGRPRDRPPADLSISLGSPLNSAQEGYEAPTRERFPSLSSEQQSSVVARIYRTALLADEAPTKLIMDTLNLPRSTASWHVSRARKSGALGPDEVGRGGGARSRRSI